MRESLFLACVILIFIFFSIFLPVYDRLNGFHNIIFDSYNLTWYDGRSPLNFYIIKNIIEGKPVSFQRNYTINGIYVENYFDLSEKDGQYYPNYSFLGNYLYASILYPFQFPSDIELFKMIMLINILFFSFILIVFYFIQKSLGLELKYRSLSTIVAGIASSLTIYNKYLFINDTLITLFFLLLIYQILKSFKSKSIKNDIIIISILTALFLILYNFGLIVAFFIYFLYLSVKYKLVKSNKTYITILMLAVVLMFLISSYKNSLSRIRNDSISNETNNFYLPIIPLGFSVFPNYIPAIDFIVYNYHNITSTWKLDRTSNDIYAFSEQPGNAIFLFSGFYGLFGSLFGSKGFIYNSIFLLFSIFGILIYRERKSKEVLLLSITLIILFFGLLHNTWYGGFTPRYVRYFDIPILFLTFFSFYYIQEISKEKSKIKKYLIYLFFAILIIISSLNVSSLSIRTDWNYEHEANLVSYDLVLWPWYPPTIQENTINLYLNELGQSIEWKFGGEVENCKPYGGIEGIVTYMCNCELSYYAQRIVNIPWEKIRINFTACSRNGDGVIGQFFFDDKEKDLFLESNTCKQESMLIANSSGNHNLILKPKKYGECNDETVIWKLITIEKI